MDVYYIFHSGFMVENNGDCVIFDYYMGKLSDNWKTPVARDPGSYNSITVFSSHVHGDHFNPCIFSWVEERPGIRYVLSADIGSEKAVVPKSCINNASFISSGEGLEVNGFDVKAYGSTDAGVSFHVSKGGLSIFHAGDLNYWHWSDESTEAEIREAREMFDAEMSKIKKGIDRIDIAFFPVDPRMKTDYYRGAVLFCMEMRPKILIPMHFGKQFAPPPEFFHEVENFTRVVVPPSGKKGAKIDI